MPIETITVTLEGGRTEEFSVGEIKLRDYSAALNHVEDEFALVAFACGREKTVITDLTPESYEALMGAVWRVNEKGFFSYAQRQDKRGAERMSRMTPEAVQALGAAILRQKSSASVQKRG